MKQTIYDNKTQNERLELLRANCIHSEKRMVEVPFTSAELSEMKNNLATASIARAELQEELSELSSGLKAKIKSVSKEINTTLEFLKDKFEKREQDVFEFDDQENGMMLTYNALGELIDSRKLRPSEKQTRIVDFNQKKA